MLQRFFPFFPGYSRNTSIHKNLELVIRQHVLPHDNRQSGARLEAPLRDLVGLQDGRPAHFLHITDADQHEQTEKYPNQVAIKNRLCTCLGEISSAS